MKTEKTYDLKACRLGRKGVSTARKLMILICCGGAICAGLLLGQGRVGSGTHRYSPFPRYDPRTRPPLSLPDAYALAIAHLGPATNRFYCVAGNCLEMTNAGFTGWTFSFWDTNGQHGRVDV